MEDAPQDSSIEKPLGNTDDQSIYLTDVNFRIDCTSGVDSQDFWNSFVIKYFHLEKGKNETLSLHNTSPCSWAHAAPIVMSNSITFLAELHGNEVGRISLNEANFGELMSKEPTEFAFCVKQDDLAITMWCIRTNNPLETSEDVPVEAQEEEERSVYSVVEETMFLPVEEQLQRIDIYAQGVDPEDRPDAFASYGQVCWDIFERCGNEEAIRAAIATYHRAIELLPPDSSRMAEFMNDKGFFLKEAYKRFSRLDDISQAIDALNVAVEQTSDQDANLQLYIFNLGTAFRQRFEHTGCLDDISQSITHIRDVIELTPEDHIIRLVLITNLGTSLCSRFEHTGQTADLLDAIDTHREAVRRCPPNFGERPAMLNNLGHALRLGFSHRGVVGDLDEAFEAQREGLSLTPENHPEKPAMLYGLGSSFLARFEHRGCLEDADEAISYFQLSVELRPEHCWDRHLILNALGKAFQGRFRFSGNLPDASEALSAHQSAISLMPEGHRSIPDILNSLGGIYFSRFRYTGDLIDLSEAITAWRRAIQIAPSGYPHTFIALSNLGNAFRDRFQHTHDMPDIEEAILIYKQAIDSAPEGHLRINTAFNGLGLSYLNRFRNKGEVADALSAVRELEKALNLTPASNTLVDSPQILNNLGNALVNAHDGTSDQNYLTKAISTLQTAIKNTPTEHQDMPSRLNNLGFAYSKQYDSMGNIDDISQAISIQQKAVNLLPKGHAYMPELMVDLGDLFRKRSMKTGASDDRQAAINQYSAATNAITGSASDRLRAAQRWAKWETEPSKKLDAYQVTVELLSQVAGLEQTVQKRHERLFEVSGYTAQATAVAFSAREYRLALEWLEQGRCLVWKQLNQLRTPLDQLRSHNRALADRVSQVAKSLETAGTRRQFSDVQPNLHVAEKTSLEDEASAHLKLGKEWNDLLSEVRSLPDFHDFLQPPRCSTIMQHLPPAGHVVIINVHELRCDALLLTAGAQSPRHIPLETFSFNNGEMLRKELFTHLHNHHVRKRDDEVLRGSHRETSIGIRQILERLWKHVVKPILDGLNLKPSKNPPRIWWCATGPLTFLPLHAAGIYPRTSATRSSGNHVSEFAVSSYIPAIGTLTDRVTNSKAVDPKFQKMLVVSQPNTPGLSAIPGTKAELHAVAECLKVKEIHCTKLEGKVAIRESVSHELETHSFAHFACHASQDIKNPLESGFALEDGRLSLSAIIKKSVRNADFAFLSACQTSTGDNNLSEEAVHLAAGMLSAGYRGVVATMWSIRDQYGAGIAKEFYTYLLDSDTGLSSAGAAVALHKALQPLRDKCSASDSDFLTWVPYVHIGY